ncbi:class I SAM-dependent methyltransferase [Alishewanella sp. SMS8]|uniref:class I SAM-dependent methyltransferase n=1 Tax=Alishewanella sp. SMS8 TaxID=2994676 RepID=UPI0027423C85|nr:methyltransferase domain-containing protein [Alishewanella sp. SMS8]MDP5458270.1 methyltransferase domain-containing protein [Alishewanella sp. SMS8]
MKKITTSIVSLGLLLALMPTPSIANNATEWQQRLTELSEGRSRGKAHLQRNQYRNPVETLMFFGIEPQMSVLEIWPVRGWYTEILAPFLKDEGQLTIAHFRLDGSNNAGEKSVFWSRLTNRLEQRILQQEATFGQVSRVALDPPNFIPQLAADQFDMVLSFRNVHIWDQAGHLRATLENMFRVLKPGGILGMVEHRAAKVTELTSYAVEGYTDEAYLIAVAEAIGFHLIDRSEVNANARDTKDYVKGVYTLPPTLALGQEDRDFYQNIGESDRMTLKFIKPQDVDSLD